VIHGSAIVEPGARLAADVEIGPFAYVGPDVELGAGVRVGAHAIVEGHTVLEAGVRVWPHAVIGGEPQDRGYEGWPTVTRVGARTLLREHVTVHRGSREGGETVIGPDCMLMNNSHVAHDCRIGAGVTFANGALVAGHVTIGDGVFLAGNVGVHQFSWVGRLAMIGGLRRVPRDVPPFVTVNSDDAIDGVNVVGLRRAGVSKEARREVVAFVARLRSADEPLAVTAGAFEPQSAEARELARELLSPRRRGWMQFARERR